MNSNRLLVRKTFKRKNLTKHDKQGKTHSYKVAGFRISFAIYIPMNFKTEITKMAISKISEALSQPFEIIFIPFLQSFTLVTNQLPNITVT
jgi:hypothetical protein